jgi:predicted dehydrogenase/nucleoside-diphosphate-sugar epimerase
MFVETAKQPIRSKPDSGPLRVALIGCGAISQQLHLPILAGHEEIKLAALVDRDLDRAQEFAKGYGVETVKGDANELPLDDIDAAIVATPPFHHAPCTISLLRRGIHVLVEKPMATNYADAQAMVEAAEESGSVLSVGFFRRLMPSMRMFKALLDSRWLGRPVNFKVLSGGFYNWGAATLGNMRKEMAGGGVLIDFGSHMIDLLHYLFEGPGDVLEYRDNALGGIESDSRLSLRLRHQGDEVQGSMELSRLRKLGNLLRVQCEGGDLEYRITERYRIWATPRNLELADPLHGEPRPFHLQASWAEEPDVEWYETVRHEIDDWLSAIRNGAVPQLSGFSALSTSKVIDDCYRNVQPLEEPWVREGLHSHFRKTSSSSNGQQRRVLVTGATGFIGSRLAEILTLGKGWQVRALVHNPANASRLARLPVEMVQGNLGSPQDARRLVEGCDTVLHCAIGTEWGERRKIFAVNVEGTRNLAAAALAQGVHRFVHLSTIALHGPDVTGTMDESTPLRPPKGDDYSESKVEAEKVLLQLVESGLPAVILRPACVYGPFSRIFINRPMEALPEGRFRLLGRADGPSNMVYVDNLIEAMLCSVEAPEASVKGELFTITDEDQLSWREFYEYFARAFGYEIPNAAPREAGSRGVGGTDSWLSPFAWLRGIKTILLSPEFRSLGQRVLQTDPVGTLPRWAIKNSPKLEQWLRRRLKVDGLPAYRRTKAAPQDLVEMGASHFLVSSAKAKRQLGYTSVVSRPRAMELTLEWVRHARLAD